jgi:hypothetical protein
MISLSFPEYRSGPAEASAQAAAKIVRVRTNFFMAKAFTEADKDGQQ